MREIKCKSYGDNTQLTWTINWSIAQTRENKMTNGQVLQLLHYKEDLQSWRFGIEKCRCCNSPTCVRQTSPYMRWTLHCQEASWTRSLSIENKFRTKCAAYLEYKGFEEVLSIRNALSLYLFSFCLVIIIFMKKKYFDD